MDLEVENAKKLVNSASKELKAVEKRAAKNLKVAQDNLKAVEKEGEKEIAKSKLNLRAAFATKNAVKLRRRALGLDPGPEKASEVGSLVMFKLWYF